MRPRRGIAVVAALGLLVGVAAWLAPQMRPQARDAAESGGWEAITWPFPRDAWPAGLAFQCRSAACGGDVRTYVRPKRGICANCATGVTTDAEVDGVADLDMLANDFTPVAPGEQVGVGALAGRLRSYVLHPARGRQVPALGIALTRPGQCDLVVAAAEGPGLPAARAAVARLLASGPVTRWIEAQLDGR